MHINQIHINNFKNYGNAQAHLSPYINFMVGENGSGKTNLLDAIHYLCFCKSYFNRSDAHNIKHDATFFRLEGIFELDKNIERITIKVASARKKTVERNKLAYNKLSEHIGLLPLVFIAPDDIILVKGNNDDRRRLLNTTLCQLYPEYLRQLIVYNKILQQRNSLLKQFYQKHYFDEHLLAAYNMQLVPVGQYIFEQRQAFVQALVPLLQQYYQKISHAKEKVNCIYTSALQTQNFAQILSQNTQLDCQQQRTSAGIHRDKLLFSINTYPLKKFGSQGQQKSFLIALKLAIFHYLQSQKKYAPILLLDDIFDRLDEQRISAIVGIISQAPFKQVFISDTHKLRMQAIFDTFAVSYKIFDIDEGTLTTSTINK